MSEPMGRKLRKAQIRRYIRTRRREYHWYEEQRIKMRESPSHWVYMASLRAKREEAR